jgi:serine/threonine protein phosphatase PrpC
VTNRGLKSFPLTLKGGRSTNEDYFGRLNHATNGACFVVADGLGGHGGGEVASRIAVEAVLESFRTRPFLTVKDLERHVLEADGAIRKRKSVEPGLMGMHTTLTVLVIVGAEALWTHVGDSRLYHFRAGRCVGRTRDHSVPQVMADAGDIPESAIRHHEDRTRLLRSLGDEQPARTETLPEPCQLVSGDAFLLCTDGFWEYVLEVEMEADLAKSPGPDQWVETMTIDRILRRAPASHDNMTAVAVFV